MSTAPLLVAPVHSICKGPKEAWESIVDKGREISGKSSIKIFHQAVLAGCYVGFGGTFALSVAGGLSSASRDNPGLQSLVYGALFPINVLLVVCTNGLLFTSAALYIPAAIYEGQARWASLPRVLGLSLVGNCVGAVTFALIVTYCEMNTGGTADLAAKIAAQKCRFSFFQVMLKGVLCNWLLSMAAWLAAQAQDLSGKILGIWWPVMTHHTTGYEHLSANSFTFSMALLSGKSDLTVAQVIVRNLIPATIGNVIAGGLIVAGSYSFAFGRLGGNKPNLPIRRVSAEGPLDIRLMEKWCGEWQRVCKSFTAEIENQSREGEEEPDEEAPAPREFECEKEVDETATAGS